MVQPNRKAALFFGRIKLNEIAMLRFGGRVLQADDVRSSDGDRAELGFVFEQRPNRLVAYGLLAEVLHLGVVDIELLEILAVVRYLEQSRVGHVHVLQVQRLELRTVLEDVDQVVVQRLLSIVLTNIQILQLLQLVDVQKRHIAALIELDQQFDEIRKFVADDRQIFRRYEAQTLQASWILFVRTVRRGRRRLAAGLFWTDQTTYNLSSKPEKRIRSIV